MDEVKEQIEPAAPETATITERQLIEQFLIARDEVEHITETLKAATKLRDDLEARIINELKEEGMEAVKYEGLWQINIINGAAHASIQKGMQEAVQEHLCKIGRNDLIKSTIAAASLSSYVRECLKMNEPVPPGVTFYIPTYLRFTPAK